MEIVLINNDAIIPTQVSKGSAGLDLYSKGLLTLGGVIDSDYTGEMIVIMTSLVKPIKIKKGQKIAQLIVSNIRYQEIKKVKCLKKT